MVIYYRLPLKRDYILCRMYTMLSVLMPKGTSLDVMDRYIDFAEILVANGIAFRQIKSDAELIELERGLQDPLTKENFVS